jgi:transposase InsO family protein
MNHDTRRKVALWRLSVLGPLISMRLEHGDRRTLFAEAAERTYEKPSGHRIKLSARTIEGWYYRYRVRGLQGLEPSRRADAAKSRVLDDELVDLLIRAKREKPRRSVRRLIRILERAGRVERGALSRSTVHRVLVGAALNARPGRSAGRERRSFIVEHAGDLWMGDVMHGPRVLVEGRLRKSYLISHIDVATRYLVQSCFYLSETAACHERSFRRAIQIHGLPRTYFVDRGAAYVAHSLQAICGELGIHLAHAMPRDAEAKGAIERWHRTWREEIGDELPEAVLKIDELNAIHWAWLAQEYHARRHGTTKRSPAEHILAESQWTRSVPRNVDLDAVFMHRCKRLVRKDGTVSFGGRRLEVLAELCGQRVELRYDPQLEEPRPTVWIEGSFVCDTTPLDLVRNATRRRRTLRVESDSAVEPTALDPLGDLQKAHYERWQHDEENS